MTMCACFLLGSVLAYALVMIVYRLHIHQLSRFPGPRLAAVTGLYEIYFAAWGVSSFKDEIQRMHEEYGELLPPLQNTSNDLTIQGPVVRITPDEVHVQEQFYNPNYADCWIKGTKALGHGRHQPGRAAQCFEIRKRSISRARSILQIEFYQIIRGLVQKHQEHKVFSSRMRQSALREIPAEYSESDLEDGHERPSRSLTRVTPEISQLPHLNSEVNGSYSQKSNRRVLPL